MSAAQSLSHAAGAQHVGRSPLRELWHREPRLVIYTAILLAAMVPALAGLMLDERTLRDVNVWVKPLKFLISTVVLALTTAWFIGHLPEAWRRGRAVSVIVWTLIATASFEIGYISLQAALGQASHYNVGDPFHGLMYSLMGIAAVVLAGTQPALAWQLWRHGDRSRAAAYRLSVLLGLTLSFVFGAMTGMVLAGIQPPAGTLLPVIGWSMQGGDLRVAHFIGIHAAQALPLAGAAVVALRLPAQRTLVVCIALAWTAAFAYSFVQALRGLPLIAA
jgi:hypothetical protein